MTDSLDGKVAIVTGSARNIWRTVAHALSERGASLVIHGQQDRSAAESVCREILDKGGNAIVHVADLVHEQACQGLVDAAVSAFQRLDILVCNAAIRRQKPFLKTTFAEWREVLANELGEFNINVNVVAPGHVDTTRGASAGQSSSVSTERAIARKAQPDEIAAMVCHLCLPAGRYVTGQTIHVNGGMLFAGA